MKTITSLAISALLLLPVLAASGEPLNVGGSTTLLPSISTAASDFMEKYETWDKVDPSLPKEDIIIFVTGGGSSFGVKSAINGTVSIGLASRDIKDSEKEKLGEHQTYLVGKDCVAFAVSKENPAAAIDSLSKEEIAEILAGEKKTYKAVKNSLPDEEIVLLVRDAGAGSAEIVQDLVMGDKIVSPQALQMPSQGALLKKLESNDNAFAYISSGLVNESEQLHAFALEGVRPTNENVVNGAYSLARPLLMVVKGEPSPMAKAFIEYVLSEGQKLIKSNGYVPVKEVRDEVTTASK